MLVRKQGINASASLNELALEYHETEKPGKLEVTATKPLESQDDLSLAYSPGVAAPVLEIAKAPSAVYKYTTKGNCVAVITNGTAILGLGNLGPLASKPVMEGKAVLFKKFADIDSIDLEIDTEDPQKFIDCVRYLGPAFGGINLEDIKAPDSMLIEDALDELMDIPVFHDDQHGTAIVVAAALLNALELTGRTIDTIKLVVAGSGSAAIASLNLLKQMGLNLENVTVCDEHGVLNTSRKESWDQWREPYVRDTVHNSLSDAFKGADVALGLSRAGVFTKAMISSMAHDPIVFAMANPDPEILPETAKSVRPDVIIATGRSDYPNQVNNVLSFPFIFRGALNVRATTINLEMKLACVKALAEIVKLPNPPDQEQQQIFGPDYLLPNPFDSRLRVNIPQAVAKAAVDSGVGAYQNQPIVQS